MSRSFELFYFWAVSLDAFWGSSMMPKLCSSDSKISTNLPMALGKLIRSARRSSCSTLMLFLDPRTLLLVSTNFLRVSSWVLMSCCLASKLLMTRLS